MTAAGVSEWAFATSVDLARPLHPVQGVGLPLESAGDALCGAATAKWASAGTAQDDAPAAATGDDVIATRGCQDRNGARRRETGHHFATLRPASGEREPELGTTPKAEPRTASAICQMLHRSGSAGEDVCESSGMTAVPFVVRRRRKGIMPPFESGPST